jgi:hypothetical protein
MNENQNPWHMHIFNIHANIQQNKKLFIQKQWEDLAAQMMYPIWNMYSHFSKMTLVQQPVILPNINENQSPWHMHIFNIYTIIEQN